MDPQNAWGFRPGLSVSERLKDIKFQYPAIPVPNFSWNYNKSASIDSTLISAGDALRTPVSNSFNDQSSDGRSFEFGGRLIYTHNFRRRRGPPC